MTLDYDAAIAAETSAFLAAAEAAEPGAPVPWCPDWTVEDLVWHLGAEVQHFWGYVLDTRPAPPEGYVEPERPSDREALFAAFREFTAAFRASLAAATDDEPAWTWHATNHTVGFIRRRQAHEALIHRLDAENAAAVRTVVDPDLATDGVNEYLDWILGGKPDWSTFHGSGRYAAFVATDTGGVTLVETGRLTGTRPSGEEVDEVDLAVVADPASRRPAAVTVSAPAADLDAWLWHRADPHTVTIDGDRAVLDELAPMLEHKVTND